MSQLFKHAKLKVAFEFNNSVWKRLRSKIQLIINSIRIFVYRLSCFECAKRNIRHNVGNFRTRFNENVKHFISNVIIQISLNTCLKTNMPHALLSNTLEVLYTATKSSHLSSGENFYMCAESKNNNQFSLECMMQPNAVLKAYYNVIHITTTLKHTPFSITVGCACWRSTHLSVKRCLKTAHTFWHNTILYTLNQTSYSLCVRF
jgi:hypothetical protein